MKLHVIIDFMHIYYRYMFMMRSGRMKRLSTDVTDYDGNVMERDVDISVMYYAFKEIDRIRKDAMLWGAAPESIISVCFDAKSDRKKENGEYKSTRVNKLTVEDLSLIERMKLVLKNCGYNVYFEEGMEADDLIASLCKIYKSEFDKTLIYTNDADIAANVCEEVDMYKYKQKQGYTRITKDNLHKLFHG